MISFLGGGPHFRPRKLGKAIMKSHKIRIAKYDYLPIRIRPWFILFSCFVMVLLAFLGFTNFSHALPLNDKLLHFLCLGLATGVLYWVFDVEEDARRIWIWRHSGLMITGIICFFFGGIVSEFVQSVLPYKEFQLGDVIANLTGSGFGLTISYHLEKYYRHRREISRLYRPISNSSAPYTSDEDDESDEDGSSLLPYYHRDTTRSTNKPISNLDGSLRQPGDIRLGNVWDETDEGLHTGHDTIFTIGDEDDSRSTLLGSKGNPILNSAATPRIVVTAPSTASLARDNS